MQCVNSSPSSDSSSKKLQFSSNASPDERQMFKQLFCSPYSTLQGGSTEIDGHLVSYTKAVTLNPDDPNFLKVILADLPRAGYAVRGS